MEDSKEESVSKIEEDKQTYGADNNHYNTNNIFQRPYNFVEEVVRAILRCLGFEEPATTDDTCPEEDLPPASTPDEGDASDGDGGGESSPAVEPEPVLGPPSPKTTAAAKRKPQKPGVGSGRDPQIH